MQQLLYLLGDPISHSLSPTIFQHFAKQAKLPIQYALKQTTRESLQITLQNLQQAGVVGINLTAPLKELALHHVDELSETAKIAGSINTIKFDQYKCMATNTDGLGFIRDLQQKKQTLSNQKILLMGAGGAARGLLKNILECSPKKVLLTNRSKPKGLAVAEQFKPWGMIRFIAYEQIHTQKFNWIINATSGGTENKLPPLPAQYDLSHTCCYDLNYGKNALPFINWAKQNYAKVTFDGLGMLVEQAAVAFEFWYDKQVETRGVLAALRNIR